MTTGCPGDVESAFADTTPKTEAQLIEELLAVQAAIECQPDNHRLRHELAAAYRSVGDFDAALGAHQRAVAGEEDPTRAAHAMLWIARLLEQRGADPDEVLLAYLRAWETHPGAAEPLVELARYSREGERFELGRLAARAALPIPMPRADTWTDEALYSWRRLDEYAAASFLTGRAADCAEACRTLLAGDALPADQRDRVEQNLRAAVEQLTPPQAIAATE